MKYSTENNTFLDETSTKESNTDFFTTSPVEQNNLINCFSEYSITTLNYVNVLNAVNSKIASIKNTKLKKNLSEFVKVFSDELANMTIGGNSLNNLPNTYENILSLPNTYENILPMIEITLESDNAFLEWIFNNFRIGFTIADNINESTWFLFVKNNSRNISVSDDLIPNNYLVTVQNVLKYVMENT